METGILKAESLVRIDKIYSLSKGLIIKSFEKLKKDKFSEIINGLISLLK